MGDDIKYSTFEAFRPHFNALARVGFFKIVLKPVSPTKRFLHDTFRLIISIFVLTYNLQHVIRVILVRHSTDQMVDTLFILLTTVNMLGKQVTFNLRSRRIDEIINTINGPLFAASKPYHVKVLKENAITMSRLLTLYHFAVLTCAIMWTVFPIVNRTLGEEVQFTGYIPFSTIEMPMFAITLAYMSILITLQAYGNVTMDCTIVAFFAQAQIQIQILRHNLEQLVEFDNVVKINTGFIMRTNQHTYKDDENMKIVLQERFKKCVVHYVHILRFAKEIQSIFGEAMVIQFFGMAWVICMTVYKIVGLSILSAEFVSMAIYLGCMLAQLFIYCYFGTQLKSESEFVNQSIYCSDWLCLSPRFRKQLLVMMQCCARPISPQTAYVIPMSLETYLAVLKSSYTLFTVLNR